MQDRRELERARIDGRAAFAGAAYLIGVGLIFLLERVGAPDGLVRALGPLFALAGVALLGLLTRSTRVPAFFAADRAIPAPYGGLAFAASAAGLVLCLGPPGDSPLPLAGVALGLVVGALAVGPLQRATGASAASDLMATRFAGRPLRLVLAALLFVIGALVATAGFEAAANALIGLFALSRGAAATIIAAVVALMIVPGGLAGLIWGAAASAGIVLIIVYLPIAGRLLASDAAIWPPLREAGLWSDALARSWSAGAGDFEADLLVVVASALAIAALPLFAAPAAASPGERQAFRAGGFGLIFAALIGLAAFVDPIVWSAPSASMTSGLKSSAILLAALALAAAGAHSASRAWGLTNAGGFDRQHPPLASQRLARSRALALVVIALCAGLAGRLVFEPKFAIVAAAAAALGLIAPVLALALFSRATSAHAIASLSASLATALVLGALERRVPDAGRLLIGALSAAAAGFAAGWSIAIFSRDRRRRTAPLSDLFIDAPLDPGG
jgi:Na+(H+)/acetate symporter ActP